MSFMSQNMVNSSRNPSSTSSSNSQTARRTTRRPNPNLSISTTRFTNDNSNNSYQNSQSSGTSRTTRSPFPLSASSFSTTVNTQVENNSSPQQLTLRLSTLVDIMSQASTSSNNNHNNNNNYVVSPSSATNPPNNRRSTRQSLSNSTNTLRDSVLRQQQQAYSLPSPSPSQTSHNSHSQLNIATQQDPWPSRSPVSASTPLSAHSSGYNQRHYGPLVVPSPTNLLSPNNVLLESRSSPTNDPPVAPPTSIQQTSSQSSIHPQFGSKPVCNIFCKTCSTDLCYRGMRALLLGNKRIELFSTDHQPIGVALVCWGDYTTQNCQCKIRDNACVGCGTVVGYHVTSPCESCLESTHNGHYWMFHSECVTYSERHLGPGKGILKWSQLAAPDKDQRCGTFWDDVGR